MKVDYFQNRDSALGWASEYVASKWNLELQILCGRPTSSEFQKEIDEFEELLTEIDRQEFKGILPRMSREELCRRLRFCVVFQGKLGCFLTVDTWMAYFPAKDRETARKAIWNLEPALRQIGLVLSIRPSGRESVFSFDRPEDQDFAVDKD